MAAPWTGVIKTATGNLLRFGALTTEEWENDGSFDSGTETIMDSVPFPAYRKGEPGCAQMHQWTGSEWILVDQ